MKMNKMRALSAALLLFAAASESQAGEWRYSCDFLATGEMFDCNAISDIAASEITHSFTEKYPNSKYLIVFSVDNYVFEDGLQAYSVIAKLRKIGEKHPYGSPIYARANGGYQTGPTVAQQKQNIAAGVRKATADLVSEATGQ